MLLMKTTRDNFFNACKDGKRAVVEVPNLGGANACDKRRLLMMKGEDTKESWCRWSDTTKRLMSYPKCRSVEVINNLARPGSNHREVNCINYK